MWKTEPPKSKNQKSKKSNRTKILVRFVFGSEVFSNGLVRFGSVRFLRKIEPNRTQPLTPLYSMAGSTEGRPVGYVFKPTEEQLVGHFLKKKLEGEMEDHPAIVEADIYSFEPSHLFKLYHLMSEPEEPSYEGECFFFCANRRERKTPLGYWKETCQKSDIRASSDPNEIIGFKRIFVYHEGRQPRGRRTDVVNHEYHYQNSDGETSDQTVLCRVFKKKRRGARSATAGASAGLNGARANPGVNIQSDYPTEMPIPDQPQ